MVEILQNMLNAFVAVLMQVLPTSPFQRYISAFSSLPYLNYLNWFIPVKAFVTIGKAWLGVIALFYLYSVAMRWIKLIGD